MKRGYLTSKPLDEKIIKQRKSSNVIVVDIHHSFWISSTFELSSYIWEIVSTGESEFSKQKPTKLLFQSPLQLGHCCMTWFNQMLPYDTLNWKEKETPCRHSNKGGGRYIQFARGSMAVVEYSAFSRSSRRVSTEEVRTVIRMLLLCWL